MRTNVKKLLGMTGAALAVSTAMLCATPAIAHDRVNWSISVGAPVYAPSPVVYAPPPVVYEQPWRVYREAPVVVNYDSPYYYGYGPYHHHGYYRDYYHHHDGYRY